MATIASSNPSRAMSETKKRVLLSTRLCIPLTLLMSALPLKADIDRQSIDVRLVPEADIPLRQKPAIFVLNSRPSVRSTIGGDP